MNFLGVFNILIKLKVDYGNAIFSQPNRLIDVETIIKLHQGRLILI